MSRTDLRELVFTALDNAKENGYGDDFKKSSDEDIAINLLDYDADIAAFNGDFEQGPAVMDVVPFVEEYRKLHYKVVP